jgi:hypothetical protein
VPLFAVVLFGLLVGYMVLGRGFAYVGVGPLYVGEIAVGLILLALMGATDTPAKVRAFAEEPAGAVACLLLVLFCAYLVRGQLSYGAKSHRDAVLLFYVVFAFFGYLVAGDEALLDRCVKVLSVAFPLCFLYGLSYPFGEAVRALSPIVNAETRAYLFGHYTMGYVCVIGGILYFLLLARPGAWRNTMILAGITTLLVLFSRAGYLAFAVSLMGLTALKRRLKRRVRIAGYVALVLACIAVLGMTEAYLPTQNEFRLSVPNVAQRVVSIFSGDHLLSAEMADFEEIAQGTKHDRLRWAGESLDTLAADPAAVIWGKGFGFNLGEAIGFGAAVRYVHNSYVTAVVLLGVPVAVLLLAFHAVVIWRGVAFVRAADGAEDGARRLVAFLVLYHLAFLVVAGFAPLLSCPFLAANLYFVSGLSIGLTRKVRPGRPLRFARK